MELVSGDANEDETEFVSLVNRIDLGKYVDFYLFKEKDRDLISPVRKLQHSEVNKFLNKNSPSPASGKISCTKANRASPWRPWS